MRMNKNEHRSRFFDLFNIKEMEVKLSIAFSTVIIAIFMYLQLYDKFFLFEEKLSSIIEMSIGSFVGLLGFSVSGIAIIITLFTKDETLLISKLNGENVIERILGSYKFLSISLSVEILYLFVINICISSDKKIIGEISFWFVIALCVYHFCFNIFYLVALIKNCIEMYKIKQIYSELQKIDTNFTNDKNEVMIDFILSSLMNICNCSQNEVCTGLIDFTQNSSIKEKERLVNYFQARYGEKKNAKEETE